MCAENPHVGERVLIQIKRNENAKMQPIILYVNAKRNELKEKPYTPGIIN